MVVVVVVEVRVEARVVRRRGWCGGVATLTPSGRHLPSFTSGVLPTW